MTKYIGTLISLLVFPALLFALIYFGMTVFGPTIEIPSEPTEQRMLSPKEPSDTCGNEICEKVEREEQSCSEDC